LWPVHPGALTSADSDVESILLVADSDDMAEM